MNWGSLHAPVTQKSVDVYLLEANILGMPRDERENLIYNFMGDFLVDLKDEQGNRNDIVLQDGITVMIVNKGTTPLKIGVSTPALEVATDEQTEVETSAEDSVEGNEDESSDDQIEDEEQETQNDEQVSDDSEEQE